MKETAPLVEMRDIHKWYGKVHAVNGVSFAIDRGEIIGLIGDNGAGKSTLIKILAGYHQADKGEIFLEGRRVDIKSPAHARALGIETVYQEQALVDLMNVARNFFMGREPVRLAGFLDNRRMSLECMRVLQEMGLSINSPEVLVSELSGGEKQGVAIGRAMHFRAKLVLLDEPTRNLSVKETERTLNFVKHLKTINISVIFVTHNLYHIYSIADRFLVMAKGKIIKDVVKEQTSVEELTEILSH